MVVSCTDSSKGVHTVDHSFIHHFIDYDIDFGIHSLTDQSSISVFHS